MLDFVAVGKSFEPVHDLFHELVCLVHYPRKGCLLLRLRLSLHADVQVFWQFRLHYQLIFPVEVVYVVTLVQVFSSHPNFVQVVNRPNAVILDQSRRLWEEAAGLQEGFSPH